MMEVKKIQKTPTNTQREQCKDKQNLCRLIQVVNTFESKVLRYGKSVNGNMQCNDWDA